MSPQPLLNIPLCHYILCFIFPLLIVSRLTALASLNLDSLLSLLHLFCCVTCELLALSFIFTSSVHLFQEAETAGILLEIKTEGELLIPGWHFWILKPVWYDHPYQVLHEVSRALWIKSILLQSVTESHCWTWRLLRAVEWPDFYLVTTLAQSSLPCLRNKGERSFSTLKPQAPVWIFTFIM